MKYPGVWLLILGTILLAGCTATQAPPQPTPVPTGTSAVPVTTVPETTRPVFTMGGHYLDDPGGYRLLNDNDTVVKEFRVDSPSWGIYFKVQPLADNLQSCWFVVNVTNVDTGTRESYGFGKGFPTDTEQWIPMYKEGPYQLTMTGNNVKVWLTAAKRLP